MWVPGTANLSKRAQPKIHGTKEDPLSNLHAKAQLDTGHQ